MLVFTDSLMICRLFFLKNIVLIYLLLWEVVMRNVRKNLSDCGKSLFLQTKSLEISNVLKKFLDFVIVFNVILDDVVSSRFFYSSKASGRFRDFMSFTHSSSGKTVKGAFGDSSKMSRPSASLAIPTTLFLFAMIR